MLKKVIVVGCPGAGKSTFARRLHRETGLPLHHLDLLWHKPDRTTVSRREFDRRLGAILAQDRWILDGNYSRTLALRMEACDTVFLLDLPVEECLAAAQGRIGTPREDLPWVETELDPEFRQWIADFPQRELPRIYDLLRQFRKAAYVFRSREEVENYFRETWPDRLAIEQNIG